MINKKYKKGIATFLILLTVFVCFAQDPLAERYLNGANDNLADGDYVKAFNYVNYVLNLYPADSIPVNVAIFAEEVYYAYLSQLKTVYDSAVFSLIKNKLEQYPAIKSERIRVCIHEIQEANTLPAAEPSTQTANMPQIVQQGLSDKQLETLLKSEREKQESFMEMFSLQQEKSVQNQQTVFESLLGRSEDANRENAKTVLSTVILVLGVCLVIFIVLIVFILINQKNMRRQQEQFEVTLKTVANLARLPQERNAFDALPDLVLDKARLLESVDAVHTDTNALLPPVVNESELSELRKLAAMCENIGVQIDVATGRRNNSKNVAELVYKLCMQLGLQTAESMLYFAAAMIYDIGFLSIDQNILQIEQLTDEQKYLIRNHVSLGVSRLEFVPVEYKSVFTNAVLMHHENMNGTGYPAGLKDVAIPFIARLIHVAESFVSMISKRNYRSIFDKEAALKEMKEKDGFYDSSILEALEQIL